MSTRTVCDTMIYPCTPHTSWNNCTHVTMACSVLWMWYVEFEIWYAGHSL